MEAANTSETFVHFYQTAERNNPEDGHLHTRHHETLKSHEVFKSTSNNIAADFLELF
jgi:hypothetical protein